MTKRSAQRLRILLRRARATERIDGEQHFADLRDARQQLVGDEARIAAVPLQLRDQEQPFESAVRMVRDDDRRAGTRNPLQLPLVELEADLQELQRLRREVAGRSRPAPAWRWIFASRSKARAR